MSNLELFQKSDYMSFLEYRVEELKKTQSNFSNRYFAKKAGFSSPSFLNMVLNGKRRLTIDAASKFCLGLGLDSDLKKYFLALVRLDNLRGNSDKGSKNKNIPSDEEKSLEKLLLKIRKKAKLKYQQMSKAQVKILSTPLTMKLYLLSQSEEFEFSPRWLIRQFPESLTLKELEDSINKLIESRLWIQESPHKVSCQVPYLATGSNLEESDLTETHLQILKEAISSVKNKRSDERVISGCTFLANKESISEIEKRIEKFKREIESEFENLGSSNVYQMHINFFELLPGD